MEIGTIRKIHGRNFILKSRHGKRSIAREVANEWRKVGHWARVIELKHDYSVWVR